VKQKICRDCLQRFAADLAGCPDCHPGERRNAKRIAQRVKARDGHQCMVIVNGVRCPETTRLEAHHVVARINGGSDSEQNQATVCHAHHVLLGLPAR
jgi:5-methylcytosine-specific restriction endonuclease McrA